MAETTVQIECPCGWRLDLKDASVRQKTSAWASFFSHLTTDRHTVAEDRLQVPGNCLANYIDACPLSCECEGGEE